MKILKVRVFPSKALVLINRQEWYNVASVADFPAFSGAFHRALQQNRLHLIADYERSTPTDCAWRILPESTAKAGIVNLEIDA